MAKRHQKFSPEFREETAKLVVEGQQPIARVARDHGLSDTTVGSWVRKYREEHAEDEPPPQLSERARLRELERESREMAMELAFLKKAAAPCVLREGATVSEKYAFIDAERAAAAQAAKLPTVARMCALLEVSKSGFYEWRGRPVSAAQRRRELLAEKVGALFEAFDGTYGYRQIHAELLRAGERVGDELVRKLMRELNLSAVQPKP